MTALGVLGAPATAQTNATVANATAAASASAAPFPFAPPFDDATQSVIDVSWLNPAPLKSANRVRVEGAHFRDENGKRVRFFGTNLVGAACFPELAEAPKIAARLHRLGINIVRLHHMDAPWPSRNIFGDAAERDASTRAGKPFQISPESLARLDYFAYQLAQHGVYSNLNLHVARAPQDDAASPEMGKVVAYFEPKFIASQKDYARALLAHVNPYSGARWADAPSLGTVEIDNEDSLIDGARAGVLQTLSPAVRDGLRRRWTDFLSRRYPNLAALKTAWQPNAAAQNNENLLKNPRFEDVLNGWQIEVNQGKMTAQSEEIAPAENAPPGRALHLKVDELGGADWHLQAGQNGLDLQDGESYTLRFWARADAPRALPFYASLDRAPWSSLGVSAQRDLTPQWQRFRISFTARGTQPNANRFEFVLGKMLGDVWLADFSLQRGTALDEEMEASLQSATGFSSLPLAQLDSSKAGVDFAAFLIEVEREYSQGMRDFLRSDLGVKAPITCSQASYGGVAGAWREAALDFVDMHAYWEHPNFPGKPWDPANWIIRNTAMTRDENGGTLPALAMNRVSEKPFTISEYNHPAPGDYAAETLPLLASFAAAQDFDGIYLFAFNGDETAWNSDRIRGFFETGSDPNKTALCASSAILFLQNQREYSLPRATTVLEIPENQLAALTATSSNIDVLWQSAGITRTDWLDTLLAVRFVTDLPEPKIARSLAPVAQKLSPLLRWNVPPAEDAQDAAKAGAVFAFDGTSAQVIAGFPGAPPTSTDAFEVSRVLAPRGFAVFALAAQNGETLDKARTRLLTAVSNFDNPGMKWNAERTSVGENWGGGPAQTAGVTARVVLKNESGAVQVYALDERGARRQSLKVEAKGKDRIFEVSPRQRTAWYEIARGAP